MWKREKFTRAPESHGCKSVDEWLSVRDSAAELHKMLKIEEAIKIVLDSIEPLETEGVSILTSLGRVLAEDIYSAIDLSPFDNSAMDGYALLAADTVGTSESNPVTLEVIEDIPAGYVGKNRITPGKAAKIMTGAPIPEGADAVVMVEYTEEIKNEKCKMKNIKAFKEVRKGENIREKGEDVKKGELVIPCGKVLRPQEIGMIAALNISEVKVIRQPRAAILATGDEVVEIGADISPGKIRNINSYTLHALVVKYGGIPVDFGIAQDIKEDIQKKISSAVTGKRKCDMLIISGGVSVGSYDIVKDVLIDSGFQEKFWKVAIKPGKPVLFGMIDEIPVFGLPGNPGSCIVVFEQLVRPALLKMMGKTDFSKEIIEAVCDESIVNKSGKRQYVRVKVFLKEGAYYVKSSGSQSSAVLKSFIEADGLLVVPAEIEQIDEGEKVKVELF